MSNPYVGEIRMFAGNFAPQGWAFCDGSLLAISQNDVLFNLIGTTYGGDGQTTFALPDLRSRVPVHMGQGAGLSARTIGQSGGAEAVTLTTNQLPQHTHAAASSASSNSASPQGTVWGGWSSTQYSDQGANAAMNPAALTNAGGSQPHDNMLPFQAVNFIIALFGIYPSQS
jgi:microcystin-dependent protein